MKKLIFVINPGGTSTKVALFEDEQMLRSQNIEHSVEELNHFDRSVDQADYRLSVIKDLLDSWNVKVSELAAVAGRGGPFKAMIGGVYSVNDKMVDDVESGKVATDHPSLLGCLLARRLAEPHGLPSFIIDPVSVDEFEDVARVTGLKGLERVSLWHALNSRYVARIACERHGLEYKKTNLVVAHLGSGISISAHKQGRAVDVNNANDMGPFSPTRAGGLPATGLVKLCFKEGADMKVLMKRLTKNGGVADLLGTSNLRDVEDRAVAGEPEAALVWNAMTYQVCKEIGAMAVACGIPKLIVLTGGLANSKKLVEDIRSMVGHLAPVEVVPGEMEMEALASGALRVLNGLDEALSYT